jgi:predicted NBD/HSP70 family sugar kinase
MTQFPAGDQRLLRSINERAVLEHIDRVGSATRADITRSTGLSKPTVALALVTLGDRGWVQETGSVTGRKGPVAALYSVRPEAGFAIGVDIGHDWVNLNLADITGRVRAHRRAELDRGPGGLAVQVTALISEVASEVGIAASDISEVVIGVPAAVGRDGRKLSYAEGLPEGGAGLGESLAADLPTTLVLENDVNLAALAERSHEPAIGVEDFVLLTLGHGVGLGIIIGGRLYRGFDGAAGEVGLLPTTRVSRVGKAYPPLEEHLGSAYIESSARDLGMIGEVSPRAVFAAARAGSTIALAVVRDTAESIAYTIACLAPVLDPPLVILGGAIGANPDLLQDRVSEHLAKLTPLRPVIKTSELGADAVLIGATVLAVERARSAAFDGFQGGRKPAAGERPRSITRAQSTGIKGAHS